MAITLPMEPVKATRVNPKILVLYGMPKVGKTEVLSQLESNLILDLEDGAAYYEALKINVHKTADLDAVYESIMAEGRKRAAAGKRGEDLFPYKYLSIDTIDALEGMAEISSTEKYKESVIGKTFKGDSILELPQGAGYGYIRREVMDKVIKLSKVCRGLVITSHIKDKLLNKGGVEVTSKDISLTGKLSQIVCAKADAIGHLFRNKEGALHVNFETVEDSSVMGGRAKHLTGKSFEFSWDKIFLPE